MTAPVEDGRNPTEIDILRSGTYNLGFIALAAGPTAQRLLHWWQDRLFDKCVVDPDAGLFTDQRWIDLIPGFFDDIRVLRHPGLNVAYWNYHSRRVSFDGDRILVNGERAYFFHFSGIDLDDLERISKHQTRYTLGELGDLAILFRRYARLVEAAGWAETQQWPYAYAAFDDGTPIPAVARELYLRLGDDVRRFGDPFDTQARNGFHRWLTEPVEHDRGHPQPITRLWYEGYASRGAIWMPRGYRWR